MAWNDIINPTVAAKAVETLRKEMGPTGVPLRAQMEEHLQKITAGALPSDLAEKLANPTAPAAAAPAAAAPPPAAAPAAAAAPSPAAAAEEAPTAPAKRSLHAKLAKRAKAPRPA